MNASTRESMYNKIIRMEAEKLLIAAKLLSDTEIETRFMLEDIVSEALTQLYKKAA